MNYIKPKYLEKGDLVGIVSPSSSIINFPRKQKRGVKALEDLDLRVVLGKSVKNAFGHNTGTPEERVVGINNFFSDNNVKVIISSTGGYNTNSVLPFIDFNLIKKHPKIFCGFSGITVLNLAINTQTKLVTFNGPTVLPTLSEFEGFFDYTIHYFKKALFEPRPMGKLKYFDKFTEEVLWWETEDNKKRKLVLVNPPKVIYSGFAEGILWGGNLETLGFLLGTKYVECPDKSILFLEEEGGSTADVERKLTYLEQLGIFKKIKGLIFGRTCNLFINSKDRSLCDILLYFAKKYNIPVIADVDCGHINPMITFPVGVRIILNIENDPEIIFTESATIKNL